MENLKGLKVAVLVDNRFEQVEMTEPRKALLDAGAEVTIVSPQGAHVRGWEHTEWGDEFPVDKKLDDAKPEEFDAVDQRHRTIRAGEIYCVPGEHDVTENDCSNCSEPFVRRRTTPATPIPSSIA